MLLTAVAFAPSTGGLTVRKGHRRNRCGVWARTGGGSKKADKVVQKHLIIQDGFLRNADDLRRVFDEKFSDPLQVTGERFVWDLWHVPEQYTLHRTPAHDYFPPELYNALESQLVGFGERVLGCRSITPIWLSYYTNGCNQELHADVPHGPWSFVLSLTRWDTRRFEGGETFLLNDNTLDYWRHFDSGVVLQQRQILQKVDPEFNRLTIFDARIPHGVKQVQGTMDPRESRVVLHGWFTDPSPFFEGPLNPDVAAQCLNQVLEPLFERLAQLPKVNGLISVRIDIRGSTGNVEEISVLTNNLQPQPTADEPAQVVDAVTGEIVYALRYCAFPSARGNSMITLPLVFD